MLDRYLENVTTAAQRYLLLIKIAGILIENSLIGQHIDHTILRLAECNEDAFPEGLPNPVSKQIVGLT